MGCRVGQLEKFRIAGFALEMPAMLSIYPLDRDEPHGDGAIRAPGMCRFHPVGLMQEGVRVGLNFRRAHAGPPAVAARRHNAERGAEFRNQIGHCYFFAALKEATIQCPPAHAADRRGVIFRAGPTFGAVFLGQPKSR